MDNGPIVAQKEITIDEWPPYGEFEKMMGHEGGVLLASILESWVQGQLPETPQDHSQATFTKKIKKDDAQIVFTDITAHPYDTFRKIQAYHEWPIVYFFLDTKSGSPIRIKITQASYKNDTLVIERVIPEGKKEMSYQDFIAGYGAFLS